MNPQPTSFRQPSVALAPPRRRAAGGWPSLTLFLVLAALVVACKPRPGPAQGPAPEVRVLAVTATNVTLPFEFIGQLDSPQNVEVRTRVEAFVNEILFAEGTDVNQGDPLFRLDKKPLEERLRAAQGRLAEAKAALNKYEKDVARLTPLAEKRAIPQQDLDNALASVEVGQAGVASALAQVESAKLDLSYCDVVAPVSGRIGAKQVSVGSLVGKGEPTLLATISSLHPIWFHTAVSEVEYLRAERYLEETGRRLGNSSVTLILADGSAWPAPGQWVFLDRAVDTTTGTLRARAEFPNENKVLRPGMFARARIEVALPGDHILIPVRALQELQGKNFVWVVDADNQARQRPVAAGQTLRGEVVVLEGLKPGDRIIVEGVQKAREGGLVQPTTTTLMTRPGTGLSPTAESGKE